MKPVDVPRCDRTMYYNGTWLWHRDQGPVQVKVNFNGDFYVEDFEETVDAALLDHWFPRGGAVQLGPRRAVYVERKAARNMRKSAHWPSHYAITWGSVRPGERVLLKMAKPKKYHTCDTQLGKGQSIVVSRDVIFNGRDGKTEVIYRGKLVGTFGDDGFDPSVVRDPMCKRAYFQMAEEGIV